VADKRYYRAQQSLIVAGKEYRKGDLIEVEGRGPVLFVPGPLKTLEDQGVVREVPKPKESRK
jgi:hypothetical protein